MSRYGMVPRSETVASPTTIVTYKQSSVTTASADSTPGSFVQTTEDP